MKKLDRFADIQNNLIINLDREEGIFDIKTYQKALDRMSCTSSLEHVKNKSRSKPYDEISNKLPFQSNTERKMSVISKKEIKPHEVKQIVSRISNLIKNKIDDSRNDSRVNSSETDKIFDKKMMGKLTSYSAYINSRKKIFEKQSSLGVSFPLSKYLIHKKGESQNLQICQTKSKQIIDQYHQDEINFQCRKQQQEESMLNNGRGTQQNYFYRLEAILTKKKMQTSRQQNTKSFKNDIETSEFKTPFIRKGFMTVLRKKNNDSNLIINNSNKMRVKQNKKMSVNPNQSDNLLKNFINHTKLNEQELQLYPQIERIKFPKNSQNLYNIPQINSKSITILHFNDNTINKIYCQNQHEKLEIASITKTMTCYLILIIADKFCLDIHKEKIIVSERASKMQGTSAKLAYSDACSVYQMLHALMLPSGNDAAISLGEWGGKTIRKYSNKLKKLKISQSNIEQSDKSTSFLATSALKQKSHLRLFIYHMNKLSKFLYLTRTHFVNTHGLMNEKAYSSSQDISLLTYHAMNNRKFREIVSKKRFTCKIFNRTFSHSKESVWENTNKLLSIEGFVGVKTGITPSAGPCLTSLFEISSSEYFIITILKTKSCEMRFKQTINLLQATLQNYISNPFQIKRYKKALLNVQRYDKLDQKQDLEQLNNYEQSTLSNENQDDDEL